MLIVWFPTHVTHMLARTRRRTQCTSTYDSGVREDDAHEEDVGPDEGQRKPVTDLGGAATLSAAWEQRKQSNKY